MGKAFMGKNTYFASHIVTIQLSMIERAILLIIYYVRRAYFLNKTAAVYGLYVLLPLADA